MQLSCLPVSFFTDIIEHRMSIRDWAEMGVELGLDAIDLSILFFPTKSIRSAKEIRNLVQSVGTRICMVTSYPDFTHPDPIQRENELKDECKVVELAAAAGAELVRVTAGQAHPETDLKAGIDWASYGLRKLAEATSGLGVSLVYENHAKPGVWQYTDFSQPAEVYLEILGNLDGSGIGVNFDTANATCYSPDPYEMLRKISNQIVSVHASDTSDPDRLVHTQLGTGYTPYTALFGPLKQSNWNGWICMEEASNSGRVGVEQAAAFIRKTWRNA